MVGWFDSLCINILYNNPVSATGSLVFLRVDKQFLFINASI
jgi:hypothetical protein